MSKYSVLFEADSYHEIGPFRFPVYHDFTPGESRAYEKLNKEFASGTYKSMQLARRIADENNMKPQEALKILGNISAEENQEYLFKYTEDVQSLADGVLSQAEQQAKVVTFFMKERGQVRDPETEEWIRTEEWTDEDTDKIPQKIVGEIYQLLMWERNGWPQSGNEESTPSPSSRRRIPPTKSSTT